MFPFERILLVGFMGSGKTRVGQALAKALAWSFRDFDQEIGVRVGLPIPEIFRQRGEGFFREMEERIGAELLLEREVVLASGGGWPAALGRMEGLGPLTFSVWLKVTAEEAVRRVREEGPTRPLLAVADPVSRARALLKEREPFYGRAHAAIDATETGPEELARRIIHLMNEKGREMIRPLPPYK
ncbi:MAG: shikimate kinase [Gemmatimonadota bacterium]